MKTSLWTQSFNTHAALNALIVRESSVGWRAFCTGLEKQKDVSKICKALV
jgi:hypothetical protein